MMRLVRPEALLAAVLLAACGGAATTSGGPTPAPTPQPGDSGAPVPTTPGHGSAVIYRPVRNAAYRLERHDSLVLQYPGGATQEQVRDRVAFLHVTVTETAPQARYQVTIVLDSLEALENGQPAAPDSLLAAKGTKWTGSLSATGGLSALTPDRTGTLPDELTGRLRLLFPALPAGGVREGMEWTDTTEYTPRRATRRGCERGSHSRARAPTTAPAPAPRRTRSCRWPPRGPAAAPTSSVSTAYWSRRRAARRAT
jgi:hypothetical protein